MIQAEAGMHCSVAVVVENRSNRTIHIDRVAAAWLGPDSVAPIVSPPRVPYDAVRTDPKDDSDVLVNVDEPLRPGERVGIKVSFDTQPTCTEPGVELTYGNWPAVDISALGRRHRIHAAEDLKVKVTRSTSSSHC